MKVEGDARTGAGPTGAAHPFNPRMLTLAREARGLTQKRLAELSETSQGAVSKAENGQAQPSAVTVAAWAKALSYHAAVFYSEERHATIPPTFFRKKASLRVRDAKQVMATITLHTMMVERLAQSVELPEPHLTSVSPARGRSPSDLAAELRLSWGIPPGPIENLTACLERAGVVVMPLRALGHAAFDGLCVWRVRAGGPPIMFVNPAFPMDRLRFTMAHELGHLVMHLHQAIPPESCEGEADEFAAAFLMPEQDIRRELRNVDLRRLAHLKRRWRVAMQALLVRADRLHLVSRRRKTSLWKQISALGYRTREPVELDREVPRLAAEMVRVHQEDLGYTDEELAAALHLSAEEFRESFLGEAPRLRRVK